MRARHDERGSVLLPLVASMLVLLYASEALSDSFSAQRYQAADRVRSAQAYWAAEAGAWHAAQTGADVSSPVSFQGSTYTATLSGSAATGTGVHEDLTRVITLTISASSEAEVEILDEAASAASAEMDSDEEDKVELDLHSAVAYDVEIESFELSCTSSTPALEDVELDEEDIWEGDESLPTGTLSCNEGDASDRTIEAGDDPEFELEFDDDLDEGTYTFTLIVNFTDGSSDSVTFSVEVDD